MATALAKRIEPISFSFRFLPFFVHGVPGEIFYTEEKHITGSSFFSNKISGQNKHWTKFFSHSFHRISRQDKRPTTTLFSHTFRQWIWSSANVFSRAPLALKLTCLVLFFRCLVDSRENFHLVTKV